MKKITGLLAAFLCAMPAWAENVKIVDGDSLEINEERIRLNGIDAPEFLQVCRDENNEDYSCGQQALRFLESLIAEKSITCDCQPEKDKYGRKLCECFVDNLSINREMVHSGWAYPYRDDGRYMKELEQAQTARAGMWQGKNMRPALYRILEKVRLKKTDP
ncbi:MAG: thermonuclease family protein [Alphaproteobacteria bacterium]|nr:thermonuclease family protein [Alphaproteobacteria bacterium]